jgi:spore coat polysaccharide biosynthesis protein SpsF
MSINNKNVVAIIVARLSSSRLPGKHFIMLLNKPLISWTLDELRKSTYIDRIVIATTDRAEDDKLYDFALQEKIDCYRYEGKVDDVTKRIRKTAYRYHADIVVSISGDCPLIYAPTIDRMVEKLSENKVDTCTIAEKADRKCIHEGIGVMTADAWRRIDDLSIEPFYQEHPGSYVKDHPIEFMTCSFEDDEVFYEIEHRISVDTPADLEFMNQVFSILYKQGKVISLPNVIDLLKRKPDLMEINIHVYQKKVKDKSRRVLLRVNGGKGIGFGHIMREITIARSLMESYGAGVRFLVNDDQTVKDELARQDIAFFHLSPEVRRESEIDMIKNIFEQFKFHAIILDLNGEISVDYMKSLKPLNIPLVSVDNASEGACLADVNIFPVAHFKKNFLAHCGTKVKVYGGPEYIIIDEKFHKTRHGKKERSHGEGLNVLITFGGTDPNNLTARVVRALMASNLSLQLDVVLGPAFQEESMLEALSKRYRDRIALHRDIEDLSALMSGADIAYTAAGITAYELAYMGVPSVVITNYRTDEVFLKAIKKLGISLPLGYYMDVMDDEIINAAEKFENDKDFLKGMARRGKDLIDGHGAKRIAEIVIKKIVLR